VVGFRDFAGPEALTVFLVVDHRFRDGSPLLLETMPILNRRQRAHRR